MSTVPEIKPAGGNIDNGMGGAPKPSGMEGGRKKTAWMTHVKATMRAHKGMKLMQVLKLAKKTYKKGMKGGSGSGANASVTPALVGGRRRKSRKTRRSRRGGDE